MYDFDEHKLLHLSLGAALLGSGGGGDPAILYGQLHYLLKKYGPIKVIQVEDLKPEALVIPLALIGVPLISAERIPNSKMFLNLLERIKIEYPKRDLVLMPAEIGGCNALVPFLLAAQTGLPVLDADLIGRAFPKLEMCKPAILGKKIEGFYLSSPFGDCLSIKTQSIQDLEAQAREATLRFGCSAGLATFLFTAEEKDDYLISGSISRALSLGSLMHNYPSTGSSLLSAVQAKNLGSGFITEVHHRIKDGFLRGYVDINSETSSLRVHYQNEYLLVQKINDITVNTRQKLLAESPALIVMIESRSGLPLTSETLRYGLKVDLFSLPAPAFWEEPRARKKVNLQAFSLNEFSIQI